MINTSKVAINLRAKLQIWPKKVLSSCSLMSDVFQEFFGNAEHISNLAEMEWIDIDSSLSLAEWNRWNTFCKQGFIRAVSNLPGRNSKKQKRSGKAVTAFLKMKISLTKPWGVIYKIIFPSAQQVSLTLASGWAVMSLTLFSLLYLISFISLTFLLGDHSQRLCFYTVK